MDWDSDGDEDYSDGILTGLLFGLEGIALVVFLLCVLGYFGGRRLGWW